MKRIRYLLTMAVVLMSSTASFGQENFDPAFPTEPGAQGSDLYYSRIVLLRNIEDGGTVSGAGKYAVDKYVTVYAYTNTGYRFINWTDTKGNVLNTSTSFKYLNSESTDTLIANYRFDPSMPGEPAEPSTTLYYRLVLKDTQGLTVSGGGRYLAGANVKCSSSVESGYKFLGWYSNNGTKVSEKTSFTYTMPVDGDTLTAHCTFDPGLPSEPGDPILKHHISVSCNDGGYWNGSSGRMLEGTSFSLSAYRNDGYEFKGWYLNGELYTTMSSFSYTVGKENLNFFAKFEFNPSFPKEPAMPAITQYSYYLPTMNGEPGDTLRYAINLVNTEVVKDLNIRLTFPSGVVINPNDYTLSNYATGYTVTVCEAIDTISIIEEGAQLWDFTLIGGTTEPATQSILTFDVILPDTIDTGYSHEVKINQISMTMADGTAVTAHTRNGRIGIYKLDDTNGDNIVNLMDKMNMITRLLGRETEVFIEEVSDTNEDGEVDFLDAMRLIEIITIE